MKPKCFFQSINLQILSIPRKPTLASHFRVGFFLKTANFSTLWHTAGQTPSPSPCLHTPASLLPSEEYLHPESWHRGRPSAIEHSLMTAIKVITIFSHHLILWKRKYLQVNFQREWKLSEVYLFWPSQYKKETLGGAILFCLRDSVCLGRSNTSSFFDKHFWGYKKPKRFRGTGKQ